MSLISDTGDASRLIKYLKDSIPAGEHPEPHAERVSVRLDVVQVSIDHIDWLEKGNQEWCELWKSERFQHAVKNERLRITANHLDKVLNQCRTAGEQQKADTEARDWLQSIGHPQ